MIDHAHPPEGIDVRDWFAGLAMHAMLSNAPLMQQLSSQILRACDNEKLQPKVAARTVSTLAYLYSDSMLEASCESEPDDADVN